MAKTKLKESIGEEEEKKEAEDQSFEEIDVDARLLCALHKKGIVKPTPIQGVAIPLILVILFSNFTFRYSPINFTST